MRMVALAEKLSQFEPDLFEAHSKASQRTWRRVKKSALQSPVSVDEVVKCARLSMTLSA